MPLIKLSNLQLHYGLQIIFDDVSLQLEPGDRLCVIGRNGVGKSTLLKVISGDVAVDGGQVWADPGVVVASLSQDLPEQSDITISDYVASGRAEVLADLKAYDIAVENHDMAAMERLQQKIETNDGWGLQNQVSQVLTRLSLDGDVRMNNLSGGWRRRAALARALVSKPDVLLLDEPTNHLDIAAIKWLEEHLQSFPGAIVLITHDRAFLRAISNKIAELDRGHLTVWEGDYDGFLEFKEHSLEVEAKHDALFDKRLAQEEVWIRQGIKARRTRNEGRVRALEKMRVERQERRARPKTAKIEHAGEVSSGKLVAELIGVNFGFPEKPIVSDFSTTIMRGDKVGLLGPNGIGKSTLLKLILGELSPQSGKIRTGTKLSIAYFDQMRDQLDLEKSAIDNIGEGRDFVEINGKNKHVISYLQDFLFSGERARTPIKSLSGGERNRILLAKLFSKPSNLLVMDEPTNDLDAETLELLEDLLVRFDGTLLLVSHDREFLDNVVTSTIAFEGNGELKEYVGGYQDWVRQGGIWPDDATQKSLSKKQELGVKETVVEKKEDKPAPKKLSYKIQRELDALPAELEKLEAEIESISAQVSAPEFYQEDDKTVADTLKKLADKESQLSEKYERWEELELMREGG